MLGVGVRRQEDATLPGGPYHLRHIKSQPFEIAYDEAITVDWSNDKIDQIALLI